MKWLTLLALASLTTPTLAAQSISGSKLGLSQSGAVRAPGTSASRFARDSVAPNQWKKGMIIGGAAGLVTGVAFYALWHSFEGLGGGSGSSSFPPALLLGPILIFGLVGGLIGSMFRK